MFQPSRPFAAKTIHRRLAAALCAAALPTMAAYGADLQASTHSTAPAEIRRDTPSGLPVPRFVSLKSEKTFCRGGPSFAHPVRITFVRRGLPVRVVAETRDHWRKIRDSDGDECWIHRTKLSGAKTVIVLEDGAPVRARPAIDAAQKARLGRGVIAKVEAARPGWVKISTGKIVGWTPERGLWGEGGAVR